MDSVVDMFDIQSFLSRLPHQPGIYQMLDDQGQILYIGKARDLKKRITSYFSHKQQDIKTAALLKHVISIDITVTHSENEALLLECNLIKKHRPHYNVLFRDDKTYPYILITTDQTYPKVEFYRGSRKRKGTFFGPFPNTTAVRDTINLIEKLFHLRTCNDRFFSTRDRPCLQYQIGRCSAPCVHYISAEDYQVSVHRAILFLQGKNNQVIEELNKDMERAAQALQFEVAAKIRDQVSKLREIQSRQYVSSAQGEVDVIGLAVKAGIICIQLVLIRGGRILGSRSYFPIVPMHSSHEEILMSFITQHYLQNRDFLESMPREIILGERLSDAHWLTVLAKHADHPVHFTSNVRGERKKWFEIATNSARESLIAHLMSRSNTLARFSALKEELGLTFFPTRIECFDISHSMGEATVASCVVFNQEGPLKRDYRRFNITDITPGDDIAAMRQALSRRYKKLQTTGAILPDILLMDGGKAQLNVAKAVLAEFAVEGVFLIGVSKGPDRKPGFETLHQINKNELHLPPDSIALHLIQQVRDEAHRFAITGHRMRRDKKRRVSFLESIPGIGAKRRRDLLRYFGGIQAINRASLEELAKVPGINRSLAKRIFSALHDTV